MNNHNNLKDNNIKIGSRILSEESLKILLPNYKNIYTQISEIRENTTLLKKRLNKYNQEDKFAEIASEEPEFVKHHNNVFSILGERGSGKTSVLLTIKSEIMKSIKDGENEAIKKNDTVLPIVVPQDMDEESDSLGWIIGFFTNIVEKIELDFYENKDIFKYKSKNRGCFTCGNEEKNRKLEKVNYVKDAFEEVKKAYFLRKEEYKKTLSDVTSKKDYIHLNSETLAKDIELSTSFKCFIDEYIEYKKNKDSNINSEALIYIFFDDVDISTRKCLNVLETIIRFLSHSNVVIFVSGNYMTFEETIVINYLFNDKLLDSNLIHKYFTTQSMMEEKNALNIRKELAYDYLKKVLSPALRYELKKIRDEDKVHFKYNSEQNKSYKSLYDLLIENFGLKEENFLIYKDLYKEQEHIIISLLFRCFDDKPRGLMNVYYYLNSMSKQVSLNENTKGGIEKIWTYEELNRFLDIIIDSSSKLNIYKENIRKVIKIKQNSSEGTSIDIDIDIDIRYSDIFYGKINKDLHIGDEEYESFFYRERNNEKNLIEDSLKLDVLILGMLFDGIFCALTGRDYQHNFIETKEYNEINEIKDFLNKKILGENNSQMRLMPKMLNPYEMLHVYSIAQKYNFSIKNKREYILNTAKVLIDLSIGKKEFSEAITKIEKSNVIYVDKYISEKVVYEKEWMDNLSEICKEGSKLLSFDIEENLGDILHHYFFIDKKEIFIQNKEFLKKTTSNWNKIIKDLEKLETIDIDIFNEYFNIRNEIINKEFLIIDEYKDKLRQNLQELYNKLLVFEKLEAQLLNKKNILKNEIEREQLYINEFNNLTGVDNNTFDKHIPIKDYLNDLLSLALDLYEMEGNNKRNYYRFISDEIRKNIYEDINDFLNEGAKLKLNELLIFIRKLLENDLNIDMVSYKEENNSFLENKKYNINNNIDIFQLIVKIIIQKVEEYEDSLNKYKIMNDIEIEIKKNINGSKDKFELIYKYLGKNIKNTTPNMIIYENNYFKYNCEIIDEYYFVYIFIYLLKRNKMEVISLKKDDIRKLSLALKYKDDELLYNEKFIKLPDGLNEKLKLIKNELIYKLELGEAINENLIYIDDFVSLRNTIEEYNRRMKRHSLNDIRARENFLSNEQPLASLEEVYSIIQNIKISFSAMSLSIREKINFRVYSLLYAIIVKETTPKDIYEEKEEFYKNLLKSLGDYDKKLRSDAFKLLD